MTRVLLAEDSPTTREHLVHLIGADTRLQIVGVATDGAEAVELTIRSRPDVALLDVHMPRLDGLEATRRIMERAPTPIVLMSASMERDEVLLTFEALKAGAVTVVQKPSGFDDPAKPGAARALLETLRLMAEVRVVRRWPPRATRSAAVTPSVRRNRVSIIAIGASTGGPRVLAGILSDLPRDLGAAILVVQHIATGFAAGFAEWLATQTGLRVRLASEGVRVEAGTVYVAPNGLQMELDCQECVRLTDQEGSEGFCPSVSHTFTSLAVTHAAAAMGILLTGMGRDGVAGLRRLRDAGAVTVAQNEETSVVFGMPGEAVRCGAAEHVLAPAEIARLIRSVVQERKRP